MHCNKKYRQTLIAYALISCLVTHSMTAMANDGSAPVSGFARAFLTGESLSDATITILETKQEIKTDKQGNFGPFHYPIGEPITLIFSKPGYVTTQSATVVVPKKGLAGSHDNITFQVPSNYVYLLLKTAIGAKENPESCHVTATILAYNKTMDDSPQGEEGATIMLTPYVNETPFYFDIFTSGPFKDKTYPFPTGLTNTSKDGGIALFNLPPRAEPYRLTAQKQGTLFSETQFICRKGAFINISPPRGPMAEQSLFSKINSY
jgi:hypothetical protein